MDERSRRTAEALPDAGGAPSSSDAGDADRLYIGDPFAMISGCELIDRNDQAGIPGAAASVRCECGQGFRIDLTASQPVHCPKCEQAFTHVLLVCPTDDDEIASDALAQIFEANGYEPAQPSESESEEQSDNDETTGTPDRRSDT